MLRYSFVTFLCILCISYSLSSGQSVPDSHFVPIPGGTFTMGEPENVYEGPPGGYDAFIHSVILSPFHMGKTEITNQQYVDFLNEALEDGLIEVDVEARPGPDLGFTLVYGSMNAPFEYRGEAIQNLSGTRVMKDHDNGDGDNDPFTGEIEPENPLNISYIGYDENRDQGDKFYVKDPANPDDFDWAALTNYYNYTNIPHQEDKSVLLNDYADWEELSDYPNNLPTLEEVKSWPATFIRWYGAKAFVLYYDLDLPTEAQWEFAAQGGAGFVYATSDGGIAGDGSDANWNFLEVHPSRGHVLDVYVNDANPYGLYNLAGNVWEWVEDWYHSDYYQSAEGATDPVNTNESGLKVRRGGSWNYHRATLKSAARGKDERFKGNDHFGFRVVRNSTDSFLHRTKSIPHAIVLQQNYPNPFNASTTIPYTVQKSGDVSLQVYDMGGRIIETLVRDVQSVGSYSVTFDAHHLASGVYYYRLTLGNDKTVSRKMLLLR